MNNFYSSSTKDQILKATYKEYTKMAKKHVSLDPQYLWEKIVGVAERDRDPSLVVGDQQELSNSPA